MSIKDIEDFVWDSYLNHRLDNRNLVLMASENIMRNVRREVADLGFATHDDAIKDGLAGGFYIGGTWIVPFPWPGCDGMVLIERAEYDRLVLVISKGMSPL